MSLPDNRNVTLKVGNENVQSGSQLKALGLLFDHKLEWNAHVENLIQRINKITNGLRIIRRKFNAKQLSQIVTSQVFGVMYYGAATWLTPTLKAPLYKKLNKIHYAASRIITGDWRCTQSKEAINQQTKRLPPKLWSKYNATSTIIKLLRNHQPTILYSTIMSRAYLNRRHPNPTIIDLSKNLIGRKAISNWIGKPLNLVKTPWHGMNMTDDSIRRMLKHTFYPQNYNWLISMHRLVLFSWFYLTKSLYFLRHKRSYKIMHVYILYVYNAWANKSNEWMNESLLN